MKKITLSLLSLLTIQYMLAQEVSQRVIVEHFTNTRCSICNSRNPALFSLLENYDEVHLAYYPSSPFSSCIFSQHNTSEADGRTNYYNIYGSTPRVVLNGEVVPPGNPLLQQSRIDTEIPNTTPFEINVKQEYIDSSNVRVSITVYTVSSTTISNLKLHAMLAEKLVNYNAPNGENTHPNVFRKALYGLNGMDVTVPAMGDSIRLDIDYTFDPEWVKEDVRIIAFVQDDMDKSIKQANNSPNLGAYNPEIDTTTGPNPNPSPTSINELNELGVEIYPNPARNFLVLNGIDFNNTRVTLYNLLGTKIEANIVSQNSISLESLNKGLYFIELVKDNKKYVTKFYKQ